MPGLGMKLVYVAPGSFQMGSTDSDIFSDEKPVHRVTISKGYWIGKYEVTQNEYQAIMGHNPSHFKGSNYPVESVSWNDAVKFCKKLSTREQSNGRLPSGYDYRLPTEAEWEFAARGGTRSRGYKYSGSDDVDNVAWYNSNLDNKTHEVGTKSGNELGIYDMSGNVWEWCYDWYGSSYNNGTQADPAGPVTGSYRVARGGCWGSDVRSCRSASRSAGSPVAAGDATGFRIAIASVH